MFQRIREYFTYRKNIKSIKRYSLVYANTILRTLNNMLDNEDANILVETLVNINDFLNTANDIAFRINELLHDENSLLNNISTDDIKKISNLADVVAETNTLPDSFYKEIHNDVKAEKKRTAKSKTTKKTQDENIQ